MKNSTVYLHENLFGHCSSPGLPIVLPVLRTNSSSAFFPHGRGCRVWPRVIECKRQVLSNRLHWAYGNLPAHKHNRASQQIAVWESVIEARCQESRATSPLAFTIVEYYRIKDRVVNQSSLCFCSIFRHLQVVRLSERETRNIGKNSLVFGAGFTHFVPQRVRERQGMLGSSAPASKTK